PWRSRITRRRAVSVWPFSLPAASPRFAIVIRRSTNGRSSLPRATVVVRCSYFSRELAWFRSIAMRCSVTRPSFRCATRCLMFLFLRRGSRLIDAHAEAQPHRVQDFLDLVQTLAPEVLRLQHLRFGLLDELADRSDVRVLQAVVRAHRELQLLDRLVPVLVARACRRLVGLRLGCL